MGEKWYLGAIFLPGNGMDNGANGGIKMIGIVVLVIELVIVGSFVAAVVEGELEQKKREKQRLEQEKERLESEELGRPHGNGTWEGD
ncbi:hypothetical protein KKE60_05880 [Patescibacteria group bacterium]|nr:hypothetical protein [Patescibacteria group bacterium]